MPLCCDTETAQTMSHILKDLTIEELETQKGELVEKCETLKAENGKIHKEILQVIHDENRVWRVS